MERLTGKLGWALLLTTSTLYMLGQLPVLKNLQENSASTQWINAAIAAFFVIGIVLILLKHQSDTEQERKRHREEIGQIHNKHIDETKALRDETKSIRDEASLIKDAAILVRDDIDRLSERTIRVADSRLLAGEAPSPPTDSANHGPQLFGPPERRRPLATTEDMITGMMNGEIVGKTVMISALTPPLPALPIISQISFIDCNVFGPAVLTLGVGCAFRSVGLFGSSEASFIRTDQQYFTGIIQLMYCEFRNCYLAGIGFIGTAEAIDRMDRAFSSDDDENDEDPTQ